MIIGFPLAIGLMVAKFSATVLPVTVRQSPWIILLSKRYLITAGVPPYFCISSMTYLPEGFKSAKKGVLSEILWKSSRVISTSTALAIAIKCSTALVLPPRTITIVIAFSKAFLVIISLGLRSISKRVKMASPASLHSAVLRGSSAGVEEEKGRAIPIASIAVAIVFAVYMPPQAPGPGQEFSTISCLSSSVIFSYILSPKD
mmetsp:Transcript_29597/g.28325  ORF Transcript_29597/g.28325 Transcript_29597/m.28325 type:complete len:202 (-) Transcript_29597:688-1293(-)